MRKMDNMFPDNTLEQMAKAAERMLNPYGDMKRIFEQFQPMRSLSERVLHQMSLIDLDYASRSKLAIAALGTNPKLGKLPTLDLAITPTLTERVLGIRSKNLEQFRDAFAFNSKLNPTEWSGLESLRSYTEILANNAESIRTLVEAQSRLQSIIGPIDVATLQNASDAELQQAWDLAQAVTVEAVKDPATPGLLDKFMAACIGQRGPVQYFLAMILVQLILSLLQHLGGQVLEHYVPPALEDNERITSRHITEVRKRIGTSANLLSDYRFITAAELAVHQNPKVKSPEISRLKFGVAVQVVRQIKDFTLVTWTDKDNDVEIQGWVLSRYLSKFI